MFLGITILMADEDITRYMTSAKKFFENGGKFHEFVSEECLAWCRDNVIGIAHAWMCMYASIRPNLGETTSISRASVDVDTDANVTIDIEFRLNHGADHGVLWIRKFKIAPPFFNFMFAEACADIMLK